MFDSPIAQCRICGQYVVLDQTQSECAREHKCEDSVACPLQDCFTGIDFSIEQPKENLRDKGY